MIEVEPVAPYPKAQYPKIEQSRGFELWFRPLVLSSRQCLTQSASQLLTAAFERFIQLATVPEPSHFAYPLSFDLFPSTLAQRACFIRNWLIQFGRGYFPYLSPPVCLKAR